MGNKKRNHPLISKPPRPPLDTATEHSDVSPKLNQEQINSASDQFSSIKSECLRAVTAFHRGNHAKALRLMKEMCVLHENCGLVYAVQGNLHAIVASRIDNNSVLKQRHLKIAVDSGRRAVTLSPNSIQFGSFYANALFKLASDVKGYDEVVRECERALSIENSIDPAEECIEKERSLKKSTIEERVSNVRKRLNYVLQKSRDASLSMKNLGKAIPLKDDAIEVGLVDTSRPNAIRNEIKTWVLQEKSDSDNSKMSQRKKQAIAKEILTSVKKMVKSRLYWNAMTDEKKCRLIELRVGDLREHYRSFKGGLEEKVISEAIDYAHKNKSWKFWACYFCDEKFEDLELRLKHFEQEHGINTGQKLEPFVFPEIDADWADMLVNGTWKPVDTPRAIKIIGKELKSQVANLFDEDCNDKNSPKAQLSYQDRNKSQLCCGSESGNYDHTLFGLGEFVGYFLPTACKNGWTWPLSDDIERADILQKIHRQFQVLVRDKFLTVKDLNRVIAYTMAELQNLIPASLLQIQGLEKSPLCICFLEESKLKKILQFLEGVSNLSRFDSGGSEVCANNDCREWPITERIVFTGDCSGLLDDRLLRVEFMPHRHHDGVEDDQDGSASTCSICDDEIAVPLNIDAFTQWLFGGPSIPIREEIAAWTCLQHQMKHNRIAISEVFEEKLHLFQSLRSQQCELLRQYDSLQAIESICAQELKKREQGGKHVPLSYESLLRKMLRPLVYADEDALSPTRTHELNAIVGVLIEYQDVHHSGVKEALNITSSRSIGLGRSEHEDQEDTLIRLVIQKKIDQSLLELCRIDAPITRAGGAMWWAWQLLAIYEQANLDYRGIMLPLVRKFINAKIEAWINEDERQKSDAVREVFLSELALDTKKTTSKADSPAELPKKTSKGKKKIKDYRKVKDPKATCGGKLTVGREENAEPADFPVVAASASELRVQAEELKDNLVMEDRKLNKMLEYQRQVEDEAKQRVLAKQTKSEAAPLQVEELDKQVVVCSQRTKSRRKKHKQPLGRPQNMQNPFPYKANDTSQGRKNLPSTRIPELQEDLGVLSICGTFDTVKGPDIICPGLRNDSREYNCFLNVIVQAFWHLRKFREEFMSRSTSEHVHIGDPCVVCALQEMFVALSVASANKQSEAISPTSLRKALIKLNPDRNLFEEPHMYDASEVLAIILESLHESLEGSKCDAGSWDCGSDTCIAHKLFGMDILEKTICSNCGIESSRTKYTSFFYGICTSSLRATKNTQPESHFDELFKLVESNYVSCEPQFGCDPEVGGCGKPKRLFSCLRRPPYVFTIALNWMTDCESREDISATLTALTTEIDMDVFHDGLVSGNKHSLFAMVCYFGQHFICFAYSHELQKWMMFDDETVEEVGCWDDIVSTCERGRLQPQILFFEAVN